MDVMQSNCKHSGALRDRPSFQSSPSDPIGRSRRRRKDVARSDSASGRVLCRRRKKPIYVRKAVVGHVANRLQAAVYREVVNLIEKGVVDVADADTALCWGPGLRWGVMGANLLFHLGGGEGGIHHFMDHLSGPVATWWKDLGTQTEFTPEVKQTIIDGVLKEAGDRSIDQLSKERDEMLLGLLAVRAPKAKTSSAAKKLTKVK